MYNILRCNQRRQNARILDFDTVIVDGNTYGKLGY